MAVSMNDTPLPKPEPDDDDEDLPITLPASATVSRFGPAAIDYSVNLKLQELIPKEANTATVTLRVKGEEGDRLLTGVVATRVDDLLWDIDLGLALGGAVDLDDRKNFQVEFLGVVSWK